MLSISPSRRPRDLVRYFATHLQPSPDGSISKEPEDAPGRWYGDGAYELCLNGAVLLDPFSRTLLGVDQYNRKLAANGGDLERRGGWDLTLSAPKTVSVLWGISDPDTADSLMSAHQQAVAETLERIGSRHLICRRGKGGKVRENAKMITAIFQHVTSRANDPHLHSHCVVCNLAQRMDGTWGAIESRPLFQNRINLGRFYQQRLGNHLEARGFPVEQLDDTIRIADVDPELERIFSTRRAAIEQQLRQRGWDTARGAEIATLASRPPKRRVPIAVLREGWREKAEQFARSCREERYPEHPSPGM